ncbi:uncharacterized protein [Pseudochaenichthys georgianus]|uniref:uncharacterized protein n=1 Tax=Pseudochaenichthys georgianus TaxID=52239 RepID=UPI00146CCDC8|nr:uncharacterized protein LOC117443455 [Pseudochaenichthys georgianus]
MSGFRRIVMSSFLMLLLHFPAADGKYSILTVRAGDELTLPFENLKHDQGKCERTIWTFYDLGGSSMKLLEDGQIHKEAKAKSDRLRVTENCTLVIKNVTEEDAGVYLCRSDSEVLLHVVSMTGYQDNYEVTLLCSVSISVERYRCEHSVKWLLQGRDVDKDHIEIKTSQSPCSASVTFQTSFFSNTYRSECFTCAVTDGGTGEVHLFPLSPQSSGDATTTGTPGLLRLILVSVGLAALIVTVVTVHIWTRAKGGAKRMRKNLEQNDEDEVNDENDGGASASV